MVVGRLHFPIRNVTFQGRAVKLREGTFLFTCFFKLLFNIFRKTSSKNRDLATKSETIGWYRNDAGTSWGCFYAKKLDPVPVEDWKGGEDSDLN